MKYQAYDYQAQRWVEGAEGVTLLIRQLSEDLELLESPEGDAFFQNTRKSRDERTKADVIAEIHFQLAALRRDADGIIKTAAV